MSKGVATGEACMVVFGEIVIDQSDNVRKVYERAALASLADSIKRQGQLDPFLVERHADGTLRLVSGFRRAQAIALIHGAKAPTTMVPCIVRAFSSLKNTWLANMTFDEAREPVKRFDLATRLEHMSTIMHYKGKDLAKLINMSDATVSNLIKCIQKLHPEILAYWEAAPTMALEMPYSRLVEWAKFPHEDQIAAWNAYRVEKGEIEAPISESEGGSEGEGEGEGEGKKTKEIMVSLRSKSDITAQMLEMQSRHMSLTEYEKGLLHALEWATRERAEFPKARPASKSAPKAA
jgi:ParB/RepB/Spo0J family partition protein